MTQNKNLAIFSETEKFALYGIPDFNDKQQREYFSFSEKEFTNITRNQHTHINVFYALQLGYFKAKKIFFQLTWEEIPQEDLQFIIGHYFADKNLSKTSITNHEFYTQRKEITKLFGYQPWSKDCLQTLYEQATQIIKRDTAPNFIARELIAFLDNNKVIRPSYTTLQAIVSRSLTDERKRISVILDRELNYEHKLNLNQLMVNGNAISKLAGFKQDAKNFGFKMMLKERQKYSILEPLYNIAKDVLPKLYISKQNIDTYANLTNYYSVSNLRKLQHNQNYLYILCYVLKRYQQLNDNLIEAFIYHIKKLERTIKDKVTAHFVDETTDSQETIGNLLLLYVNEKFDDVTLFGNVRNCAFKIMSKENIQVLGQSMLNKPYRKKELKWQEIDKAQKSYRKSLRPLFMKLGFSSELTYNPWLKSVNWLHQVFTNNQKLSDRPFSECPTDTIPKYLQRYLLASNTKENKIINGNRYEYWVYCQVNKQISNGELYIENSLNHRCFNHELVVIDQKEEVLKKLNIPWLQQSIDQQLNNLTKELHDLWLLFNKNLKQEKFTQKINFSDNCRFVMSAMY